MQSTCVELVWEQLSPEAPADEDASIVTPVLETARLSVTRIVVLVMVEELVNVGAVMAITGTVASIV